MDSIDLQLALGRAGLSARQLRAATGGLNGAHRAASASLESLIGQSCERLMHLGLSPQASAALATPDDALIKHDRRWLERTRARRIDALSDDFPPQLAGSAGAAAPLYVQGDVGLLPTAQLAMVGSRRPTEEGRRNAYCLARQLAQSGLTITSGLALGIDAASHTGGHLRAQARRLPCSAAAWIASIRASTKRSPGASPKRAR